jgi:hypothetical protein
MTYNSCMAIFNRQQCKWTKIKEARFYKKSKITNQKNTEISSNYFQSVKYLTQI